MSGTETKISAPPPGEVAGLAEHLFRAEAGKLVSVLTRIFGIERLQLAEDVVQEALVRAMQTWPYHGIPENPAGWLTQTAKNLALDVIRRDKVFQNKEQDIAASLEEWSRGSILNDRVRLEQEMKDDTLRLMFACCHPLIPQETQAALALKTLCGFGTGEIAKAFLSTDAAIAKRLTRARQTIRELQIPFEIPSGNDLVERIDGVMQTLYLLFNEGYKASSGDSLLREELCHEAIRLTTLLAGHPSGDQPRIHALLALMLMNGGRLGSRVDAEGHVLRLKDQDRIHWNRSMIGRGLIHFGRSTMGDELSEYHIQAGIAACHCMAADYESTDWLRILALYDLWTNLNDSPVVALNRAVAVANVHGPARGMEAMEAIRNRRALVGYYLLYAVLAEFETQLGNHAEAITHLREALKLTAVTSEQTFLTERLRECEEQASPVLKL